MSEPAQPTNAIFNWINFRDANKNAGTLQQLSDEFFRLKNKEFTWTEWRRENKGRPTKDVSDEYHQIKGTQPKPSQSKAAKIARGEIPAPVAAVAPALPAVAPAIVVPVAAAPEVAASAPVASAAPNGASLVIEENKQLKASVAALTAKFEALSVPKAPRKSNGPNAYNIFVKELRQSDPKYSKMGATDMNKIASPLWAAKKAAAAGVVAPAAAEVPAPAVVAEVAAVAPA